MGRDRPLQNAEQQVEANPKIASAWQRGLWVGKTDASGEHLVLTPTGAQHCRSIRRLPEDKAHVVDFAKSVRGTPWDMGAGAIGRPRLRPGVGRFLVALPVYPGAPGGEKEKKTDDPFEIAVDGGNEDDDLDLLGGMVPRTPPGMDDVAAPSTPIGLGNDAMGASDLADEPGLEIVAPPTPATRPAAGPADGGISVEDATPHSARADASGFPATASAGTALCWQRRIACHGRRTPKLGFTRVGSLRG